MSLEYLPPAPVYPAAFHVRPNWCDCHPETCCCNDWAVHAPDGTRHSTHFPRSTAQDIADALEHRRQSKPGAPA